MSRSARRNSNAEHDHVSCRRTARLASNVHSRTRELLTNQIRAVQFDQPASPLYPTGQWQSRRPHSPSSLGAAAPNANKPQSAETMISCSSLLGAISLYEFFTIAWRELSFQTPGSSSAVSRFLNKSHRDQFVRHDHLLVNCFVGRRDSTPDLALPRHAPRPARPLPILVARHGIEPYPLAFQTSTLPSSSRAKLWWTVRDLNSHFTVAGRG